MPARTPTPERLPESVYWRRRLVAIGCLLLFVIVLLLVAGQTIIFLLRLVAADRRSRRRPLGSATKTVGELEDDAAAAGSSAGDAPPDAPPAERDEATGPGPDEPSDGRGPVQQ